MTETWATQRPFLIIGAGIAGLVFARILAERDIPVIVFERSTPERTQGYGITLRHWAYKPLLTELGDVSLEKLERAVAVDAAVGGCGWIDLSLRDNATGETLMSPEPPKPGEQEQSIFRVNRSDLRVWLEEGVDVRYDWQLLKIEGSMGHVSATFANGKVVEGSCIIAADGLHSTVRRQLYPQIKPAILPVVVFHGDVHMSLSEYQRDIAPALNGSNILGGVGDNFNTPITIARAGPDGVDLDWSYSRAIDNANGRIDPLWMPERDQRAGIPPQLVEELRAKNLAPPFSTLLDVDAISQSTVYNWLSRSVFMPRRLLDDAAAKHGVIFMGDAAHAMPIFGGEGGNHAMLDGVELARLVTAELESGDEQLHPGTSTQIAQRFYDGCYSRNQDAVRRCRQRFGLLHRPMKEWKQLAQMAQARTASAKA